MTWQRLEPRTSSLGKHSTTELTCSSNYHITYIWLWTALEPYLKFWFYSSAVYSRVFYVITIKTFSMMTILNLLQHLQQPSLWLLMDGLVLPSFLRQLSLSEPGDLSRLENLFNNVEWIPYLPFFYFLADVFYIHLHPTDESFRLVICRASENICYANSFISMSWVHKYDYLKPLTAITQANWSLTLSFFPKLKHLLNFSTLDRKSASFYPAVWLAVTNLCFNMNRFFSTIIFLK